MDPQASASTAGVRLVAVSGAGAAMVAAVDDAWNSGAAALPLDARLPADHARAIATELGAAQFVDATGHGLQSAVALPEPAPVPAGTALVVRTSGTTGTARGVVLGHRALHASVKASIRRLGCRPGDHWLCVLPLHHVAGLLVVLRARALGTEPIVHERFDPDAIAATLTETRAAPYVALVPTMLRRLLDHGVDVSRFRGILLGGAAAPPDLLARARAAGANITVSYGMTETSGGCVYDGIPLDDVAAAVDPDGRVLLRGPVLATGYRDGHALTPLSGNGWLRTADLGQWVDGRLRVSGRVDDVVVSGGVNVSTDVVADLLRQHPAVDDAAAVGMEDPEWGQRVVAFVVPSDPAHPPAAEDLRAHVRAHAGPAHAPRDVVTVPTLPRTSLGKVDRGALLRQHGLPSAR